MAKTGKISIKHYLGTNLKGSEVCGVDDVVYQAYPVYVQVGYKRKVNKIKSRYYKFSRESELILVNHLKKYGNYNLGEDLFCSELAKPPGSGTRFLLNMFDKEKVFLENLIQFLDVKDREFNMQGISSIYDKVTESIISIVDGSILDKIRVYFYLARDYERFSKIIDWKNCSSIEVTRGLKACFRESKNLELKKKIKLFESVSDFYYIFNKDYGHGIDVLWLDWKVKNLEKVFNQKLDEKYSKDSEEREMILYFLTENLLPYGNNIFKS